jgi:hypothetical protein
VHVRFESIKCIAVNYKNDIMRVFIIILLYFRIININNIANNNNNESKSHIILSLSVLCYVYSEKLFRTMTDLVISEGYAAVGYEYINVDDCWLDFARSYDGRLQPDAKRFPRGMADLSEYVSTYTYLQNIYIHTYYFIK